MKRISGESNRLFRLCVDSYEEGVPEGRLFHPNLENGGFRFRSLTQLVLKIEELLDGMNYPQSFTAKRTFAPAPVMPPGMDTLGREQFGARGTFLLRVIFRQHTTWQGTMTWLEGRGEQNFRSVLELILLMNSALTAEEPDSEEGGGAVS